MQTRRQFVASLPALIFATSTGARCEEARATPLSDHPTPRPGITAAKVLTRKQLGDEHADAAPVFDMVRQIPHIVDGIRCRCGCAELEGNGRLE